jgi:3-oxoacyl-[acyl-carrier protein] reductase
MELDGRAAIVTGASRGVGRATALALASRGCDVVVNYSRSRREAEAVVEQVRALGARAEAVQADVGDDASCRTLIGAAEKAFGRLDVLINNAGTTVFIPHAELERVGDADWDHILAVNLKGPFQCARAAKPLMDRSGGGEIVNVSSVAGIIGTGSSIPYCASKAALNMLTVTLARVLAPKIRVNAVAPGFIAGSWLAEGLGPAYEAIKSAMVQRAPLGRVCEPEDVAAAILSLVTGSDLVTGHVLPCEGGMLIAG